MIRYWLINGQPVSDIHSFGYTEYMSSPLTVWTMSSVIVPDTWRASPEEPDIGDCIWITKENKWFKDEAELNDYGYTLIEPKIGLIYGVMNDIEDYNKDVVPIGACGEPRIEIKGALIDSGVPPYGVIKEYKTTTITIGINSSVPEEIEEITSNYWWMYSFNGGNSLSNLWTPQYYSSNILATTPSQEPPDSEFDSAIFWDGSSQINFGDEGISLNLKIYQDKPEIYTTDNRSVNGVNCGIIIEPGSSPTWTNDNEFKLPEDIYTITGTSLTWNTSHILYNILNGVTATVKYYD